MWVVDNQIANEDDIYPSYSMRYLELAVVLFQIYPSMRLFRFSKFYFGVVIVVFQLNLVTGSSALKLHDLAMDSYSRAFYLCFRV